ncbi:hypothetical protein [Streptomyces sp. NPDC019890]|uniref:hypothetical protein n=1 Tax=Streptomyces sp. NPDC019890 TaxID=3365064 RepID=UPI00384D04D2
MAKLAAERFLTEDEIHMLGGVRQAFKVVRRSIKRGEPIILLALPAAGPTLP